MASIDIRNKSIVITGASSGIGRATAIECARAGMRVVAAARRADRLDDLVDEITLKGGEAVPCQADVRDARACETMIELALDRFGACDAVFANAGITLGKPTHAVTETELREIFEVNVSGSMNAIRPAVPHMIERRSGHILFCSSVLAMLSVPNHGAYSATKAAQHHLARAMRAELKESGVRVSTVHPIGTKTEIFETARQKAGDAEPFKPPRWPMQSPQRVARAVVACLRRPKPEVWTSQPTRIGAALLTLSPRLTDFVIDRLIEPRRRQ